MTVIPAIGQGIRKTHGNYGSVRLASSAIIHQAGSLQTGATQSPPASYALTGKHAVTVCTTCHTKLQDNYIKECYSCHKAKYDASVNPKHSTIGFGTTCEQCHNTTVWEPSTWSHSRPPASWPLTGFHTTLTCTNCHPNSQQLASRDCYSCHKAKYDASTNPKHSTAKIGNCV